MRRGLSFLRTGPATWFIAAPRQHQTCMRSRAEGKRERGGGGGGWLRERREGESDRVSEAEKEKGGVCKSAKPWFTSAGSKSEARKRKGRED